MASVEFTAGPGCRESIPATRLYLKALYEHPTHPIVALFADQALLIGKEVGREEEVIAGLTHVSSIPMNFQGKDKVEAVLMEADTRRQVTRSDVAAFANR